MTEAVHIAGHDRDRTYLPVDKWFIIKAGSRVYRCKLRFEKDHTMYTQFLQNFEDEARLQMEMRMGLTALANCNFNLARMLTSNLEITIFTRKPCPKVARKAIRWHKHDHHGVLVPVQFVLQVKYRASREQLRRQSMATSHSIYTEIDSDKGVSNVAGAGTKRTDDQDVPANGIVPADYERIGHWSQHREITTKNRSSRRERNSDTMTSLLSNDFSDTELGPSSPAVRPVS